MTNYAQIKQQLYALTEGVDNSISNYANTAALLFNELADVSWVGFYFVDDDELILGPFQGLPACVRIKKGHGVCGEAWVKGQTLVIPNVCEYANHIACDSRSMAEIVIPIRKKNAIVGVMDIDSYQEKRFTSVDQKGLESLVEVIENFIK